jgi:hypothetical protein
MQRHTACTGPGSPGRSHTRRSLDTSKQSYDSGSLSANRSQGIYGPPWECSVDYAPRPARWGRSRSGGSRKIDQLSVLRIIYWHCPHRRALLDEIRFAHAFLHSFYLVNLLAVYPVLV